MHQVLSIAIRDLRREDSPGRKPLRGASSHHIIEGKANMIPDLMAFTAWWVKQTIQEAIPLRMASAMTRRQGLMGALGWVAQPGGEGRK